MKVIDALPTPPAPPAPPAKAEGGTWALVKDTLAALAGIGGVL
jgi:hypothetical protein